mgnify:CR=1 FL=1
MKHMGMKKKMGMTGGGMMKKGYKAGGMPMNKATGKPTFVGDGKGKMMGGGKVKAKMAIGGGPVKAKAKMAMAGGKKKVTKKKSIDGIARQGKTKGKQIA